MALYDLELVPEPHDFSGSILLSYSSGAGTILVIIPRIDLVALLPGLAPPDQDVLVLRNLEAFKPIIEHKLDRGDVKYHTNPGGRQLTLIELLRSEIEQALRSRNRDP